MDSTHITEIKPQKPLLHLGLSDVWRYRDLVMMMVRRDFVATYKQTILGPVWFFIQPLFTTLIFTFLFARMGKLSTDGLPPMLFYLCGITFWNYFSSCLKTNSSTFIMNQNVFGKVYFPRLVIPISVTISNLVKLGIQFVLFMLLYVYFILQGNSVQITQYIVFLPFNILLLGLIGLALGILFSSLTTKYRDLTYLLDFGIQLLMYATIIFPVSAFPENFKWMAAYNPIMPLIETTKLGLLGQGTFDLTSYLSCIAFTLISLLLGIVIFNKTEQNFMDVV